MNETELFLLGWTGIGFLASCLLTAQDIEHGHKYKFTNYVKSALMGMLLGPIACLVFLFMPVGDENEPQDS